MNLEELYIQEINSRESFNEVFAYNRERDLLLDEAVNIVNEAYIGKTLVLEQIEDLISQIRGKITRYKDFDRMKEVQALNRLFEKQFGMDVFALHMIPENVMNAYTCVIARNFDVYRRKNFSDYLVADRKDGFKFRSDNNFCIIANVYYGLFTNPDLTDGEILAIILHEIGHNFADFLDDNIRLANQYIMDSWMATNIAQIIVDAIQLNIIGVIGDISNVIQGLTMMNNFKKNKMEKINQKGKERTISPTLKGLSGKTSDFFGTCANILYKYNIITLGFKGIGKLFRKPFENFLKNSAKKSVDRRNEIIADKFATVYGYGPELTTGLQKMSSYKSKDYTIIDKLPFGKKFNEAWDKLYLDINEFDCHPHDIQRANECIKTLKDELEQEDMDPKLKSVIKSQINDIEFNILNIKSMVEKDPNNIQLAYSAYIANELPDATTKAIEDEINQELNDALRECSYEDNGDVILEGKFNRVTMGFQIKPKQDFITTLKKHQHPGYINLINKQKNIEDLKYLRQDCHVFIGSINKLRDKLINKDMSGMVNYVKMEKFNQEGVTVKDCDLTIKWFKEVALKRMSEKIKEINDQKKNNKLNSVIEYNNIELNEDALLESCMNELILVEYKLSKEEKDARKAEKMDQRIKKAKLAMINTVENKIRIKFNKYDYFKLEVTNTTKKEIIKLAGKYAAIGAAIGATGGALGGVGSLNMYASAALRASSAAVYNGSSPIIGYLIRKKLYKDIYSVRLYGAKGNESKQIGYWIGIKISKSDLASEYRSKIK